MTHYRSTKISETNTNRTKEETECNAFILGDFNTPFTPQDRYTRQKISKDTEALNNTLEQMDLIDIYRTLHPKQPDTHSSQVHMEHSPE